MDVWVPGNLTEIRAAGVQRNEKETLCLRTTRAAKHCNRNVTFFNVTNSAFFLARFIYAFYMILAINNCFPQHCIPTALGYLDAVG